MIRQLLVSRARSSVSWRLASDKGHSPQRRLVDHPGHQGFWFAGARGRRFSEWTEMEFYEQAWLGERSEVRHPFGVHSLSS
jgi:hypothetical protein